MKLIPLWKITDLNSPTALALGFFDGVHRGHREILKKTAAIARKEKLIPAAFTFLNHPATVLGNNTPLLLTTFAEKKALMADCGIKILFYCRFTPRISALAPQSFIRTILLSRLKAKILVTGENYTFGQNAAGNSELLTKMQAEFGFKLRLVDTVTIDGTPVSSSFIRQTLSKAELELAARLLGRPYSLSGKVKKGTGKGSRLGFPSANLKIPKEKLIPPAGIYLGKVKLKAKNYPAVADLKTGSLNPSPSLDIHILDFEGSIYREELEFSFLKRLRAEIKFSSEKLLKEKIKQDIQAAGEFFCQRTQLISSL